jgi:hypothetical protein
MYWECANAALREDGTDFEGADGDFQLTQIADSLSPSSDPDFNRRPWWQLVAAYTQRDITQLSDRFPALSGVTAELQNRTGDKCYAGLWKSHFLQGLHWNLQSDHSGRPWKTPIKPESWRAPSWSFLAVEGIIDYTGSNNFGTSYCANLEDCSITTAGANPLGELEAGHARIRGPVTAIELLVPITRKHHSFSHVAGIECSIQLRDGKPVKATTFFDFEAQIHESCAALLLTPYTGLAISLVDVARSTYTRVGTIQVEKGPDDTLLSAFHYPKPSSVTII